MAPSGNPVVQLVVFELLYHGAAVSDKLYVLSLFSSTDHNMRVTRALSKCNSAAIQFTDQKVGAEPHGKHF